MGDDMRPCHQVPGRQCNCPPNAFCSALEAEPNVIELPPVGRACDFGCVAQGDHSLLGCTVPERPGQSHSTIALEAQDMVYGDREGDYGHPREDFTRTAVIWTGLLQHKLADGAYIDADDIARCMIGVKLARDVHSPKRDNRVDMAGYAITLDRLETGR